MLAYLGVVWRCRYFWLSLVRMDLRTTFCTAAYTGPSFML